MACVELVRSHGTEGVIFPQLADKVGVDVFGDETMLVDDRPNAVCWNYASPACQGELSPLVHSKSA